MSRKLTNRFCAFVLLVTMGSTANACCLLPFLNPFAWTCGYGCGYGAPGYAAMPWCGPAAGWRGFGHQGWGGSAYRPYYPHYSPAAPAADCHCAPGSFTPTAFPATTGSVWPSSTMTARTSAWASPGGWRPQYRWTPPATAWQLQPQLHSRTAMSTAPIYGPTWEVSDSAAQQATAVAGDIRGDHEIPVIPNSFNAAAGTSVHPAHYQPRPQTVQQYRGVVR